MWLCEEWNIRKRNKHKSYDYKNMGGHDQSQKKMKIKSSKKIKSVPEYIPKSHNDDTTDHTEEVGHPELAAVL